MINLYFTDDEMKSFLQKEGFVIKSIKTWSSYNTYHNQVENSYLDLTVAYKNGLDYFKNEEEVFKKDTVDKYQLKQVFTNVLKCKLLGL